MMQKYNNNDMLGGNVLVQTEQGLSNKPTGALLLIPITYDARTQAIININPYRSFKVSTLYIQYRVIICKHAGLYFCNGAIGAIYGEVLRTRIKA